MNVPRALPWPLVFVALASCADDPPPRLGSGPGASDAGPPSIVDAAAKDAPSLTSDAAPPSASTTLATGERRPSSLRATATALAWLRDGVTDGALVTMPIGGGTPVVLASDLVQPGSLRVDATTAYFLTRGASGGIQAVVLGGGPVRTLVASGPPSPIAAIAVQDDWLYFTDAAAGKLMRVPTSGGPPHVVAKKLDGPTSLAIDGTTAWVIESGDQGAVVEIDLASGDKTTIAVAQSNPHDVVVGPTAIYWINDGMFDPSLQTTTGGAIMTVPRGGGTTEVVAPIAAANALALDGDWLYAIVADAIVRVPTLGGAPTKVVSAQPEPSGIAPRGSFVHWSNWGTATASYSDGSIRRLPK